MERAFFTSLIAMSRRKLLTDFTKRMIKYGAAGTGPTLAQNKGQQVTSSNLIQTFFTVKNSYIHLSDRTSSTAKHQFDELYARRI